MPEERIVDPDPVLEPEAYQKALVALLGDQDALDVLTSTADRIYDLTRGLSDEQLKARPEPEEWSATEILGHMFDAEIVASFRWRLTLAQDNVAYPGYDQDKWTGLAHPPFAQMLASYRAIRESNIFLMRWTAREMWGKSGLHAERGPESFELSVLLIAGHDLAHLKQLEQTVATVTGA